MPINGQAPYRLAPICLFAYNRPWHVRQTLESLSRNDLADSSKFYIFADGPKNSEDGEEIKNILETRKILKERRWCHDVEIVESSVNKGLAESIVRGVTDIVNKHGRVIVLEDDLLLSPGFLRYMNEALNLYFQKDKVMHISGFIFPVKEKLPETFFLNATHCWGWGTWQRAWQYFNIDAADLLRQIEEKNLVSEFNFNNSVNYYMQLKNNAGGTLKTWAIKWYASVFLNNGLCLHPGLSLIKNIGLDGSGENCGINGAYDRTVLAKRIKVKPVPVGLNRQARKALIDFFRLVPKSASFKHWIKEKIKKLIL